MMLPLSECVRGLCNCLVENPVKCRLVFHREIEQYFKVYFRVVAVGVGEHDCGSPYARQRAQGAVDGFAVGCGEEFQVFLDFAYRAVEAYLRAVHDYHMVDEAVDVAHLVCGNYHRAVVGHGLRYKFAEDR